MDIDQRGVLKRKPCSGKAFDPSEGRMVQILELTTRQTVFGMDIFNFDFDGGKSGVLSISSQWWIYVVVVVPVTAATFAGFYWVVRNRKLETAKEEKPTETPAG